MSIHFRVKNNRNALALDATLRALPVVRAHLLNGEDGREVVTADGCYVVVVEGDKALDVKFVKFACTNQGYADVVEDDDEDEETG